ncbi:MAG: hypothetical protein CMF31_07945 [Kordiimonas sp.]|nr:hypothetical protein [Kordiimonas sp.]
MRILIRVICVGWALLLVSACNAEEKEEKDTRTNYEKKFNITERDKDGLYEYVDENSEFTGELWTNRSEARTLGLIHDEVLRVQVRQPIYNIYFVVYSREFADRHGYPHSHVADMADNVDLMSFQMKTGHGCKFQFLINKGQGHFLEDKKSYHAFFKVGNLHDLGSPILTPRKVKDFEEHPKDYKLRAANRHYRKPDGEIYISTQTVFLAGQAHTPNKKKGGSLLTAFLKNYHGYVYRDLDYFEISMGCGKAILNILRGGGGTYVLGEEDGRARLWEGGI